jgi:hypothetical protein
VGVKGESLIIRFHNGSMYEYPNQASQYENMLKSNSKGKWVWRNLRRKNVLYRKIGVLPLPDDIGVTDEEIFQEIDNRYMADLTRHVDVPVFQSFEFIKGINYQKIQVGNINVYKAITEPLQVGARVLPKADIEFKPAKDIQEANEYAKKFANNVDISNLNVNQANVINRTLDTMQTKFPIGKKLNNVSAKKLKNRFAQANNELIEFDIEKTNNRQFSGKEKVANQYKQRNEKNKILINNIERTILETQNSPIYNEETKKTAIRIYKSDIAKIEKKTGYNRWSTSTDSDTQEEALIKTTTHEYGHVIDFNYVDLQIDSTFSIKTQSLEKTQKEVFEKERLGFVDRFKKLKKQSIKNGQIKQVSEYGASNNYETFAETFAMYNTNEQDKLPDGFKEYFDDLQVFIKKVDAL